MLIEEEPDDQQESNETATTAKSMAPEIPKENTQSSSVQHEEEPEKPQANVESAKESPPKKQVPKNVVTSWSDWVAKTSTNVNKEAKENTTSESKVKR